MTNCQKLEKCVLIVSCIEINNIMFYPDENQTSLGLNVMIKVDFPLTLC